MSKSACSPESRKTNNVIVEANVDSSKITHQSHNGKKQITKKNGKMKIQI